ncbi:hypothetical protein DIPPA_19263 [Diplonema papillatum]|nr:hypothetical protein DIPPA_19263 [Diplonema papillatum]
MSVIATNKLVGNGCGPRTVSCPPTRSLCAERKRSCDVRMALPPDPVTTTISSKRIEL